MTIQKAPLRSMTGFGAARIALSDRQAEIELRAVNHRQLRVQFRLPPAIQPLEAEMEARIRDVLARGSVQCSVTIATAVAPPRALLATDVLVGWNNTLDRAADALGLPRMDDAQRLPLLLGLPGVLEPTSGEDFADLELWRAPLMAALNEALHALLRSREAEGLTLARALEASLARFESAFELARARAPEVPTELFARARERLKRLLDQFDPAVPLAASDLSRELGLIAERCDVQEEIDRLVGHQAQFRDLLRGGQDVGRRLDFLCQELLRETNTLGSKANDRTMTAAVIDMKLEIDRLKEQVQNLE